MFTVTLDHSFHAAHSLQHLPGKCSSIHGHTWHVSVTIAGPFLGPDGVLVEFGAFKTQMTGWIDANLDRALMLGAGENLLPLLTALRSESANLADGTCSACAATAGRSGAWWHDGHSCRHSQASFLPLIPQPATATGEQPPLGKAFTQHSQRLFVFGRDFSDATWPSVEGVAQLLAHHAHTWLDHASERRDVYIHMVTVRETDNNSATWHNPNPEPAHLAHRSLRAALDSRRRTITGIAHRRNLGPHTLRQLLESQAPALIHQIVQETGIDPDAARALLAGEMRRTLGDLEILVDAELNAWLQQNPAPSSN